MSRRTRRGNVRAFPADVRSYGLDDPDEPTAGAERTAPPERGPGGGLRKPGRVDRTAAPPSPRVGEATVFAWALLPLRFFIGATFLYAGIDKLLNPTFLQATGPGSIGQQLAGFERVSPLAPLIHLVGDPFPVLIGLLIALLEIAIGLGALLGLLFRWAAVAGAGLSFMFFLTASWSTNPYYYGPDLPYAFGWVTLALAGHGHLFSLEDWLERREIEQAGAARRRSGRAGAGWARAGDRGRGYGAAPDPNRRAFLQLGILSIASFAVATIAGTWPLRGTAPVSADSSIAPSPSADPGAIGLGGPSPQPSAAASAAPATSPAASPAPSPAPSADPSAATTPGATPTKTPTRTPTKTPTRTPTPTPTPTVGGTAIADISAVKSQRAVLFQIPTTGDPGIVVDLNSGTFVAYDAVCTHQGCTVEFASQQDLLFCPCHGAVFDPANGGQVLQGPARAPLTNLPIKVDQSTGKIYLQA